MKANFGLFQTPPNKMSKLDRYKWYSKRSLTSLRRFTRTNEISFDRVTAEKDLDDNE